VLIGEVAAPAAPGVAWGIAALFSLLACLTCLGLQHAWHGTIGKGLLWLADVLDRAKVSIPHIGSFHLFGPVSAALRATSKNVSHWLAVAALNSQHAWNYTANQTAATFRHVAREVEALSRALYGVAHYAKWAVPQYTIGRIVRLVEAFIEHELVRLAHRLGHRIQIIHKTVQVIAHKTTVVYKTAAHAGTVAVEWRGFSIRQWRRTLRRVGRLEKRFGTVAFAGLVAAALTRLGLKWLRCSKNKDLAKTVCGMDANLLESLLLDTTAILGAISVVEMARDLQAIEGEAVTLMRGFVRELP
jgi:hypothetical protein